MPFIARFDNVTRLDRRIRQSVPRQPKHLRHPGKQRSKPRADVSQARGLDLEVYVEKGQSIVDVEESNY